MKNATENLKAATYSSGQLTMLVVLRMLIGWHFLYEGIVKLYNPGWSSAGYLMDSQWIFADMFKDMAGNASLLGAVDFLNMWGLTLIGLGLILGLFTRAASIAGAVLLVFYYLSHPPLIGLTYALPNEGSYLIVNKTLIEAVALMALAAFPTGKQIGLDRLLAKASGKKVQETKGEEKEMASV